MLDKDMIKQSLTLKDIEVILRDLGSKPPKPSLQGGLIFQTVCHNVSGGSYKLYYYSGDYNFKCYTGSSSGCGDSFDIFELVIRAKSIRGYNYSFPQAVEYVATLSGKRFTMNTKSVKNSFLINDWDFINNYKPKPKPTVELPSFSKEVLEVFRYLPHESWLSEGITWNTMKKFMISYYIKNDRIVIPHFDINGRLIGIRGRAMIEEEAENFKYMPLTVNGIMYRHLLQYNLYGLYENKENIRKHGKVVIFEGEKSVLKCEDMYDGFNWSLATCGSSISNWQRDMIVSLGVKEVIIAFDKEYNKVDSEEAKAYAKSIASICNKFTPYCRVFVLWDKDELLGYKDSPIDKGREVFEKLLKSKIEIITKEPIETIEGGY